MAPLFAAEFEIPEVPSGHPRVYVRPADLPEIRQKIERDEFKDSWEKVKREANRDRDQSILCKAFVYLVTQDRDMGRKAVDLGLDIIKKSDDARVFRTAMHYCACVYDWCYDLLTDDEKEEFIQEFRRIANSHEPGYPARLRSHAVVGHTTEGWLLTDQLPAGLAIYDKSPRMYNAAAQLFFRKFVEVRNFYYPGHAHHQGDSYRARFVYDQAASWLFRRMGAGDVLSREQRFVPYHMIYCLRPDSQQMRFGDTYDHNGKSGRKNLIMALAGSYYDDPYMLTILDKRNFHESPGDRVFEILFRKQGIAKNPISELPKTKYFAEPTGQMVARTGWDMGIESRDAIAYMHIGEYFFGNHQRKDFGTFQLYYRGALAISSGIYQGDQGGYGSDHWLHYYHQTLSHNGLLIFDPEEKQYRKASNDGGQRYPNEGRDHPRDLEELLSNDYKMGSVTAHEFGPDDISPEYSYIAGDITDAYTDKVSKVTRSMVTFSTGNEIYPCAMAVFDRVDSADPGFKKTWLLHTIQEPIISKNTITVLRDQDGYNGKMVVESLLPEKSEIAKIGGPGKEFWVESVGKNFPMGSDREGAEPGAWRIEVSPTKAAKSDEFLHVMTVMDAETPDAPAVDVVSSENLFGAAILNFVVLFGRHEEALNRASFDINADGVYKILVCDLKPGNWAIWRNGELFIENIEATEDGKCLYFGGKSGNYELELANGVK